ncbi:hypothetical protein CCP3SC1AL1_440010 [Gammaproteobacteria bacterium]
MAKSITLARAYRFKMGFISGTAKSQKIDLTPGPSP